MNLASTDRESAPPTLRVRVRGVHKSFTIGSGKAKHDVQALRGVDLDIEGPGFFAIMGASGSGKSTLLHLAGGLENPTAGAVVVNGRDASTTITPARGRTKRR